MQTTSLGLLGAAAATPLAQRQTEADRAQSDAAGQARQTASARQAENAAGIGETDNDQPASDRDADGRRLWEAPPARNTSPQASLEPNAAPAKDPTGQSGSQLDLSG
jgi:hypothetical protein